MKSNLLLAGCFLYACGGEVRAPLEEPDAFVRNASYDHVEADENGMIWSVRVEPHLPVLLPDGAQVSKAQWDAFEYANGYSTCDQGTENLADSGVIKVEAFGLIPNAVYTVWQFEFDETRVPLGPEDGSGNVMRTNELGEGRLQVETSICDVNRLIIAYHIDGETYSHVPGPQSTWVSHAVIRF